MQTTNSNTQSSADFFKKRRAGILLHPTSLPNTSSYYCEKPIPQVHGTLGKDAYDFVDFISATGCNVWQMLPTTPTHEDLSPYQSVSAHAGNPDLISLDWLVHRGWVTENPEWHENTGTREESKVIRKTCAAEFFTRIAEPTEQGEHLLHRLRTFCEKNQYWLDDFVLFMALREHFNYQSWISWPSALKSRNIEALTEFKEFLAPQISQYLFEQFAFFEQWNELKSYCAERNIKLFGDMPIFVAHDSADVWADQDMFNLNEQGAALTVAGVPPDYFSETGQHWGNPHYNWQAMESDGFNWWLKRFQTQLDMFDLIRIDHFRGFEAYWSIPGDSVDARTGEWVKAPGEAFLKACFQRFPQLPLVAENLGLITPEVEALRHQFNLPGMLVLQFGFDGNPSNPHLPHNHTLSDVIYTGTHDNDTTVGWYNSLNHEQQTFVGDYLVGTKAPMPWPLIDIAFMSVSPLAVVPLQDFLSLDGNHRMNMPGTLGKNWRWQFEWSQFDEQLAQQIRNKLIWYGRI